LGINLTEAKINFDDVVAAVAVVVVVVVVVVAVAVVVLLGDGAARTPEGKVWPVVGKSNCRPADQKRSC